MRLKQSFNCNAPKFLFDRRAELHAVHTGHDLASCILLPQFMRHIVSLLLSATTTLVTAAEFHVAPAGNDAAAGTVAAPLKSIYAGGQSSATWTISGLAAYATYNLVVYAATGTAGGKWTVNGTTKEAAPSAGAATLTEGNQFVRFAGVRANGYGQLALVLAIRAGQSYGEMAGLELETVAFATIPPLSISQAGFSDSAFAITATGLDPSCRYVLTRSADLTDGFPLVMGSAFTPAGPTAVLTDPAPPPGSAFYRLELLP